MFKRPAKRLKGGLPSAGRGPSLLTIDGDSLTVEEGARVARAGEPVRLARTALRRVEASRDALVRIVNSGRATYGVNTGFGELEHVPIPKAERLRLQENTGRR